MKEKGYTRREFLGKVLISGGLASLIGMNCGKNPINSEEQSNNSKIIASYDFMELSAAYMNQDGKKFYWIDVSPYKSENLSNRGVVYTQEPCWGQLSDTYEVKISVDDITREFKMDNTSMNSEVRDLLKFHTTRIEGQNAKLKIGIIPTTKKDIKVSNFTFELKPNFKTNKTQLEQKIYMGGTEFK